MNTNQAYNDLKTLLEGYPEIKLYQDHAPKDAKLPYTVFRLEDIVDNSPSMTATLKLMCYDDRNVSSTKNIEIADKIRNIFNKKSKVFETQSYHSVLSIYQNIPSEYLTDKQCIEMQYNIVIYNKERDI